MQHNTQVPVGKHNIRQHASPHHEAATDVKQMPIRPIIRNEISAVKNHKKCFTTNNYDVNYIQLIVLCYALIYVFITNWYINNEYLFIHGIPEAILWLLATENEADGW